jgi:HJR/Mrr/RecB family endonuclease
MTDEEMVALAILCQSYLVAHTDLQGEPSLPAPDPIVGRYRAALTHMGLTPAVRCQLRDLDTARRRTEAVSWWTKVFVPAQGNVTALPTGHGPATDALFGMLRLVASSRSRTRTIEPALVVEAYLEIIARFDGPRVVLPESGWDAVCAAISSEPQLLHELHWRRFEDLLAALLERFGWRVEPMGYTKDDGIDIIAIRRIEPGIDVHMLVQCKKFAPSRKVGVELVKELWATKAEHSFDLAMLATTSNFTRGAVRKADLWKLALRDYDAIIQWCRRYATVKDGA